MCDTCHHHEHEQTKTHLFIRAGVSILLFLIGFKFTPLFIFAYVIIGYDVILQALKNIFKGEVFDENFLMMIATVGALCIKEFPEAYMVMFLYQLGEYLQTRAVDKSKDSITELMDIRPDYANRISNGIIEKLAPEEITLGDIILVRAGEKIPLDGVIVEGSASIDLSSLTGESIPKNVQIGDNVFSGSINLDGVLKVCVTNLYENSTVSKILEMLEHSKSKKTKTETFITRFAKIYTPLVVALAIIIAVIPQLFFVGNWLERALTFLVISCPCALVISVPLTFFAGIGRCSRDGILVKGSVYLERLSRIKAAVFDKTGTLTKGKFEVIKINSDNPQILKYASIAECNSNHPIALAIKKAYGKEIESVETKEIAGFGVKTISKYNILAGNSKFVGVDEIECNGTVVYVSVENEYIGNIVISDTIKYDSKETIEELNKKGINTVMLTGDIERVAKYTQRELGIKSFYAELLPDKKVKKLEEIMTQNSYTIFIGDGINDAPVLERADVGIAMGSLGSDAAIEASDIVIMDDRISKLLYAIKISEATMKIVKENIILAIGIKILFLTLSLFGFMTMWGAVFADVGVTLLAILNALRVLRT